MICVKLHDAAPRMKRNQIMPRREPQICEQPSPPTDVRSERAPSSCPTCCSSWRT